MYVATWYMHINIMPLNIIYLYNNYADACMYVCMYVCIHVCMQE